MPKPILELATEKETRQFIKDIGCEVLDSNGKMMLVKIANADDLLTNGLYETIEPALEKIGKKSLPFILLWNPDHKRTINLGDRIEELPEYKPDINVGIEFCLKRFKKMLGEYKKWRTSVVPQDVTDADYVEALTWGIEGGEGDYYISPRFIRFQGGIGISPPRNVQQTHPSTKTYYTPFVFWKPQTMADRHISLANEDYVEIANGYREYEEGRGSEANIDMEEVIETIKERFKKMLLKERIEKSRLLGINLTEEECMQRIEDEVRHYLKFMDEDYAALEQHIEEVESYAS